MHKNIHTIHKFYIDYIFSSICGKRQNSLEFPANSGLSISVFYYSYMVSSIWIYSLLQTSLLHLFVLYYCTLDRIFLFLLILMRRRIEGKKIMIKHNNRRSNKTDFFLISHSKMIEW